MTNMSDVIKPKSDQLNAEDFLAGERTFTIRAVEIDLSKEQPVSVFLEGEARPFKPSKSMSRIMTHFWGEDQTEYNGRMLTLFRDDSVTWGGEKVGGIRISHMSHLQSSQPVKVALAANKKQRKTFTITPIVKKAAPKQSADDSYTSDARAAASLGTDHFRKWFADANNAGKRASAKLIMPELQKACADADKANEDPFGLPPTDDVTAQQAELDAAHAEIEALRAAEMAAE